MKYAHSRKSHQSKEVIQVLGNKRALLVRSNPVAPDPRVEKTARALVKSRISVNVLCWARDHGHKTIENLDGYQINRIEIPSKYGKGLMNLGNLLRWQWAELVWLWKNRKKYDLIHACDFDTVIPALLIKFLFGKVLIYDIFDYYSDHLRNTPKLIKYFISKAEILAINFADGVIIVDEARIDQIKGSHPRNLTIIYNSPEEFRPSAVSKDSVNSLVICYVGLLQIERGLLSLLDILGRHPNWHLDIAGFGGDEQLIVDAARKFKNVEFHGRVDYATALQLGTQSDVFYALYDPKIPNHKYASPNKVFEAMMLGKPILVANNTHVDKIIEEWECGFAVDYENVDEIDNALNSLSTSPEIRETMGRNARQAYQSHYSWQKMEYRLLQLYSNFFQI